MGLGVCMLLEGLMINTNVARLSAYVCLRVCEREVLGVRGRCDSEKRGESMLN